MMGFPGMPGMMGGGQPKKDPEELARENKNTAITFVVINILLGSAPYVLKYLDM